MTALRGYVEPDLFGGYGDDEVWITAFIKSKQDAANMRRAVDPDRVATTTHKTCTGPCGQILPVAQFHANMRSKDGRRWTCNACTDLKRREVKPEPGLSYRERLADGSLSAALTRTLGVQKKRAHEHGAPVTHVTARALLADWQGHGLDVRVCVYCGDDARSVDHVEPVSLGGAHSVANFVPACLGCNASKNDRPLDLWHRDYLIPLLIGRARMREMRD